MREEAGEDRLNEGSEYNLGAVRLGESHPQDKDELEGVVESCDTSVTEHRQLDEETYGTSKRR